MKCLALLYLSLYFVQTTRAGEVEVIHRNESLLLPLLAEDPSRVVHNLSVLHPRQQFFCVDPGYVPCPDGVHCCPATDNCYPTYCCLKGGETCGRDECFQAGARCCPRKGACNGNINETCCSTPAKNGCCASGSSCCPQGNSCCLPNETCCPGGCCQEDYECAAEFGRCQLKMPVFEVPYTPLVLDDVVKNMCLGMGGQNEVILTYSSVRNDGGKCAKCCRNVFVPAGKPYAGERTTCDEFPFARTYEALQPGAHLACVDWYENSFQGWWYGSWVRLQRATRAGFRDGTKYIARVTGLVCSTVKESDIQGCGGGAMPKLVLRDNTLTTSGSETKLFPSIRNSSNIMIVPFGDLDPGRYTVQVQLSGQVDSVVLWDSEGEEVGDSPISVQSLSASNHITFDLSDATPGVALIVSTQQKSANLTWTFEAPMPTSSTTGPTSTTTRAATSATSSGRSSVAGNALNPNPRAILPLYYCTSFMIAFALF